MILKRITEKSFTMLNWLREQLPMYCFHECGRNLVVQKLTGLNWLTVWSRDNKQRGNNLAK
jgi:hypothetical protein